MLTNHTWQMNGSSIAQSVSIHLYALEGSAPAQPRVGKAPWYAVESQNASPSAPVTNQAFEATHICYFCRHEWAVLQGTYMLLVHRAWVQIRVC